MAVEKHTGVGTVRAFQVNEESWIWVAFATERKPVAHTYFKKTHCPYKALTSNSFEPVKVANDQIEEIAAKFVLVPEARPLG